MNEKQFQQMFENLIEQLNCLSRLPNSPKRQSVLLDYRHLIDFWQGISGSEDTSFSAKSNLKRQEALRLLSKIGSVSLLDSSSERSSDV